MINFPTVHVLGCGDIGRRVAALYQTTAQHTIGWVRGVVSYQAGQAQGLEMRQVDFDQPLNLRRTEFEHTSIFWFMPPPAQGLLDTRLRQFLDWVQDAPQRIVLISTTGVYGDSQGTWIDESAPLQPANERSKRRLDAELALQVWAHTYQREYVILRVPGIYAVERLPVERLKRNEPVIIEAEALWTNRIHADDLAMIAKVAMEHAPSGAIYNATDGHPSTMTDYFNQIADYLGLPRPPQISLNEAKTVLSAGMLSYLQESRRISNAKLLRELKVELQYPNLAAALAH